MPQTYNIYRMKRVHLNLLAKKIESVGLIKQKTIESGDYNLTFYYSAKLKGSRVEWWHTYRDFIDINAEEPRNKSHFALLIAEHKNPTDNAYLVSIGKTHFYLSKYIERDFGVNLAIRMASEKSILLKKSRYFGGLKRQEISSYGKFTPNNYQPGESVEHLKMKAENTNVWGDKNIIFADSVQLENKIQPKDLHGIFDVIESTLAGKEIINLPKLEPVKDSSLCKQLDVVFMESLKSSEGKAILDEFEVYGIDFCFRFFDYDYKIYVANNKTESTPLIKTGNSIDINDVHSFMNKIKTPLNADSIKIQFRKDNAGKFTKSLKEVVDFYAKRDSISYFLKSGVWFSFNQVFMKYLKDSLLRIEIKHMPPLIEEDYISWRIKKEQDLSNGEPCGGNKLVYREFYFNEKQARENGYELLDRKLESIESMLPDRKDYKVETADLYKDNEIISVKISKDEKELIYNIEQSKDAVTLLANDIVGKNIEVKSAAIWFVLEKKIDKIIDINSIQFLLALDAWSKLVTNSKLTPRIYISQHLK